jgi:hypothetical protein
VKKVTVTLEFDDVEDEDVEALTRSVDLGTLLRDAFGEFQDRRMPAEVYVAGRYALASDRFRADKLREVAKRCRLAEALRRANVTIHLDTSSVIATFEKKEGRLP